MGGSTVYIQPTFGHPASPPASSQHPPAEREPTSGGPFDYAHFSDKYMERRAPLGLVLADKLVNGTWGSLSLDLKRPQLPTTGTRTSLFTYRPRPPAPQGSTAYGGYPPPYGYTSSYGSYYPIVGGGARRRGRPSRAEQEAMRNRIDYDLPSVAFGNTGARLKVMRHVSFGPEYELVKYGRAFTAPSLDVGAGFAFDFDTAELRPQARLKMRDVASIKLLPQPALRFQKRLQMGTSGFAVRLTYECPLQNLLRFYAPPAKLMVTVDNAVETGVRLTQSGLEFSANKWLLDGKVRVRAQGALRLPSELPISEDQLLVGFEARRLGIKARW